MTALIVSRRLGRVRERLPIVLGTVVSQTLLNLVALVVLGAIDQPEVLGFTGAFKQLANGGIEMSGAFGTTKMAGPSELMQDEDTFLRALAGLERIRPSADGFVIVDLDSMNGTKVNGVAVREHVLHDGDEIALGATVMRFEAS